MNSVGSFAVARAAGEHVAATRHVEHVARVVRETLQFVDAVIGERRHDRVRPPVTIVVARLRARVAHRLARVDTNTDAPLAVRHAEIIRRRDTGDAGTDNGYVY